MKVVLTTYLDHELAVVIDREARKIDVSRSDFIAELLTDEAARRRAMERIGKRVAADAKT